MTTVTNQHVDDLDQEVYERLAYLANQNDDKSDWKNWEDVRKSYLQFLNEEQTHKARPESQIILKEPETAGHEPTPLSAKQYTQHIGKYEIDAFKIFTLIVVGDFTFTTSTNWRLTLEARLNMLGDHAVWKNNYDFSPESMSARYRPSFPPGKADITIGLYGSKLTLRVFGNACYWKPFSWTCAPFDETLLSLR